VVVITEASERRSGILGGARPTSEDDTATTFELFFDLVYVFAMT
jgi:low temperature requirement protein LtrA